MSTCCTIAQKAKTTLASRGIYWKYRHNSPLLLNIMAVDNSVENVDNSLYLFLARLFMSTIYTKSFQISTSSQCKFSVIFMYENTKLDGNAFCHAYPSVNIHHRYSFSHINIRSVILPSNIDMIPVFVYIHF